MALLPEALESISELITVLANDTEHEETYISENVKVIHQLAKQRKEREENIREAIEGLLAQTEEAKSSTDSLQTESEDVSELRHLDTEVHGAKAHQEALQNKVLGLKQQEQQLEQKKEDLEKGKEELMEETTQKIPAIRHDVNLYSHVSNLRWLYDGPEDEVKGYICNNKSVKPFSLNSKQNSHYFIVNYLWDLMEPDW